MAVPTVAICVATHRRPIGFDRLLKGLDTLTFGNGEPPSATIIAVDNDPAASARATCEAYARSGRWPLEYVAEPRRGIPFARNAAV